MKFKSVIALVVLGALSSGCSQEKKVERMFENAEKTLASLRVEDPESIETAFVAFENIVERFPKSSQALQSQEIVANIFVQRSQFKNAINAYNKLGKMMGDEDPRVGDIQYQIAQLHEMDSNWSAAEATYWNLAQARPLHLRALYAPIRIMNYYIEKADTETLAKVYQSAIAHYEGVLAKTDNENARASLINFKGVAHKLAGQLQKALDDWRSVFELYPTNAYAPLSLLARGEVIWMRDGEEAAEEAYLQYFQHYADHNMAGRTAMNLGLLFHRNKNYEKARLWYQRALDGYFKDDSLERAELKLLLGKTYQDEVLWEEADAIYEEIEREYKDSVAAMQIPLLRADFYKSQGDMEKSTAIIDKAINQYDAILDGSKDQVMSHYAQRFRTQALVDKGAWDVILAEVDQKILDEVIPERKGQWIFMKAQLLHTRLKNIPEAISLYEAFIRDYPKHALVEKARMELASLHQVGQVKT